MPFVIYLFLILRRCLTSGVIFENFLEQIDDENKDIVITGDLNCNVVEQGGNQATLKLQDILDILQLKQHIQTPTRTNIKT